MIASRLRTFGPAPVRSRSWASGKFQRRHSACIVTTVINTSGCRLSRSRPHCGLLPLVLLYVALLGRTVGVFFFHDQRGAARCGSSRNNSCCSSLLQLHGD